VIDWRTQLANIPIIIYFVVAILTYPFSEGHGIREMMSATVLFVLGYFFLLNDVGKFSVNKGW